MWHVHFVKTYQAVYSWSGQYSDGCYISIKFLPKQRWHNGNKHLGGDTLQYATVLSQSFSLHWWPSTSGAKLPSRNLSLPKLYWFLLPLSWTGSLFPTFYNCLFGGAQPLVNSFERKDRLGEYIFRGCIYICIYIYLIYIYSRLSENIFILCVELWVVNNHPSEFWRYCFTVFQVSMLLLKSPKPF